MSGTSAPSDPSSLLERVRARREDILRLAADYDVSNLRLFGSVARGTARPDSDVDILIDLPAGYGGFRYVRLILALEDLLGCTVDLVTPDSLPPLVRAEAEREAVPL